jgi:hypothetical protein
MMVNEDEYPTQKHGRSDDAEGVQAVPLNLSGHGAGS